MSPPASPIQESQHYSSLGGRAQVTSPGAKVRERKKIKTVAETSHPILAPTFATSKVGRRKQAGQSNRGRARNGEVRHRRRRLLAAGGQSFTYRGHIPDARNCRGRRSAAQAFVLGRRHSCFPKLNVPHTRQPWRPGRDLLASNSTHRQFARPITEATLAVASRAEFATTSRQIDWWPVL
jgi:hypothetical protein